MNCESLTARIDDIIDDRLAADERSAVNAHVAGCDACAAAVARARSLKAGLASFGAQDVPMPDDAFFTAAVAKASVAGAKDTRRRYWLKGFGSAVAAALALFAVTLVLLQPETPADAPAGIPAITMSLEEARTVNLVFASAGDLADASFTVLLPDGVYLEGFEGQQEITWLTSLTEGKNVLPLRLIATTPAGGELLATLRHADDDKVFKLRVNIS